MNSGGYRYAASDQAFYIPAIVRHLEPADFPRDAPLIDGQARIILVDDGLAAIVKATGISIQALFAALYGVTLALLLVALIRVGRRLYRSEWALVALTAALTLRHSIAKTGANTLEGYFHPRMLVFALGLLGVSAFLERRDWLWIALVGVGILIHPTTAVWFGVWLGTAAWFGRPQWRAALAAAAGAAALAAALLLWRGPFAGHLSPMDAEWLSAISDKDYLFPFEWPFTAWLLNLATVPVILWCWRARRRANLTIAGETPLVLGAVGLLVLWVCWLPFDAARIAIAVELQLSRVFWLLDVLATVYVVWWIVEGAGSAGGAGGARGAERAQGARGAVVSVVLIVLSLARGSYSMFVQFPDRPIVDVDIKAGDWHDAMAWARTTDPGSGWLADPIHAALYGSSIRAAAYRDVLLERLKDRAIAMYDRPAALRVADRERALEALRWDTPDGARALARRYGLDYLIIDRELDLPLAHRSGALFIYRLR
jgi:hypothetical protein